MIHARYFGILAGGLICVQAFSAQAGSVDAAAEKKGRAIAEANCARCHALGAEGKSPHEKAPPFREIVTRYPPENLSESLAEGIVSGHPDMPVFVLSPSEIDAFLAYLNSLKTSSGEDAPAP